MPESDAVPTAAPISAPVSVVHTVASASVLPGKYVDFSDRFEKRNVDQLPEHRPYDCLIDLEDGASPPFGPIYGLSEPELEALRVYIDENLARGFI